ncbi:hypothetical protein scyTo_0004033 [Scyliorhinus torazame]|uniref:Uncharacterized protein n=1 Tax=Scyliorhinus torazame TaxID=75743 RepID=A0A401NJC5_SCYTO|nr:hypothetical protein [Scyliorhinus torazame]
MRSAVTSPVALSSRINAAWKWHLSASSRTSRHSDPAPETIRMQIAQKFTGGIGTKLCAFLYGDGQRPMESAVKEEASSLGTNLACTCSKTPCACQKVQINFSILHATGKLIYENNELSSS